MSILYSIRLHVIIFRIVFCISRECKWKKKHYCSRLKVRRIRRTAVLAVTFLQSFRHQSSLQAPASSFTGVNTNTLVLKRGNTSGTMGSLPPVDWAPTVSTTPDH